MDSCTRTYSQSVIELFRIEISDKTTQLPMSPALGILRASDKIREFSPLPYTQENLQFIGNFNFEY